MDEIIIPADVFFELPLYAAQAASCGANDARQQWAVIGALAQTCHAAAKSVRDRKSTLARVSVRIVSDISPGDSTEITSCYGVLPNGKIHGVWYRIYHRDELYSASIGLYEFGHCVRSVHVDSPSGQPAKIVIRDMRYLRVGETLMIRITLRGSAPRDGVWVSVHLDNLEMFFREFIGRLDTPVIEGTVSAGDYRDGDPGDEEYQGRRARYYAAEEFVRAAVESGRQKITD